MFKVQLKIMPRKGILNPESSAVSNGLQAMGYTTVEGLKIGKFMEFTLRAADLSAAESTVKEMCSRLLANPVIEDYTYRITQSEGK